MSLHIIIDGYNLIRQSPQLKRLDLEDIQLGRQMLIEELAFYKKRKRHRITVVFDGANAPVFTQTKDRINKIDILFSRPGELADTIIKRMSAREKEKALVVSSDRDIAVFAMSQGAAVISSLHFSEKIARTSSAPDDSSDSLDVKSWNPSTKKKGPNRRLPKRERKNKIKTRKL
ncbi:MAG: NYN domain-containing protein [Desulfobacterales bacterium]|nr:NYN domain-containing protein [Desulfobacterales bacterium]